MFSVEDESILVDFEKAERSSLSNRKVIGDRVIYASRDLGIPKTPIRRIQTKKVGCIVLRLRRLSMSSALS